VLLDRRVRHVPSMDDGDPDAKPRVAALQRSRAARRTVVRASGPWGVLGGVTQAVATAC
jgi:hypothetical protein